MSKDWIALQALERQYKKLDYTIEVENIDVIVILKQALTKLQQLEQALTPPTADELCKAIGEHLSPTSYNVKATEKGISFDYDDNPKTVTTYICIYEDGYLSFVSIDFPPHLITMIGKFYEKEGKE